MLNFLFKRTLKNKIFNMIYIAITLISLFFLWFCFYATNVDGVYTYGIINGSLWMLFFSCSLVGILFFLLMVKYIIFDEDLNYLVKIALQYNVKKSWIYFSRILIMYFYVFFYVTFLLIFYFIFVFIYSKYKVSSTPMITATIGYVAYLYIFSWAVIGILSLLMFVKNSGLKFSIPFFLIIICMGVNFYSSIMIFMPSSKSHHDNLKFLGEEKDLENYNKFHGNTELKNEFKNKDLMGVKKDIEDIFNLKEYNPNYIDYNKFKFVLTKSILYVNGQYIGINYKNGVISISNLFDQASEKTKNNDFKELYKVMSNAYKDYEKNNVLNYYDIVGYSLETSFFSKSTYSSDAYKYDKKNNGRWIISFEAYTLEHYLEAAKIFIGKVNYIDDYKENYSYFKNNITKMGYGYFWNQLTLLLMGKTYNSKDNLDKALLYALGGASQELKYYKFDDNCFIIGGENNRIYSYEFILIEYLVLIGLLNYLGYLTFYKMSIR